MATSIGDFGNGIGLLYITENNGVDFISPGIANNIFGVETLKREALTKSPVAYDISAKGYLEFDVLTSEDGIAIFEIGGVPQITTPIILPLGTSEIDAAILVANEINSTIPVSGANYKATAINNRVSLQAPSSFGDSLNGDNVVVNLPLAGNSWFTENISGGNSGDKILSSLNGARFFMDPTENALVGDISSGNVIEITDVVVMRGVQSQHIVQSKNIAAKSINDLKRYDRFSVLEIGSSGTTDLETIEGNFAKNDILIIRNKSAFTVTVKDISLAPGNIKINPDSFAMASDDEVLWVQYVEDDIDGMVWKEIYRNPTTISDSSVTESKIADLSISTNKVQDQAITTQKIDSEAITSNLLASNSVTKDKILAEAVNETKIKDGSIVESKIFNGAVTEDKIGSEAVTNDKIAPGAITLDKLDSSINQDQIVVPISWESGEQGLLLVKMPTCTVTGIFLAITKPISGSDDATLVPKDDSGTIMDDGTIDLPANAPFGNSVTSSPTGNNSFVDGETMKLETIKANPGGKGLVTITYTRS